MHLMLKLVNLICDLWFASSSNDFRLPAAAAEHLKLFSPLIAHMINTYSSFERE